jgi:TolB protein
MRNLSSIGRRPRSLAAAAGGIFLATVTFGSVGLVPASGAAAGPAASGPAAMLAAGQVGSRLTVPWQRVGPGWALAEYTTSTLPSAPHKAVRPTILYLISPAGGKYELFRWAAGKKPWRLVDWSGDKTRALFEQSGAGPARLHELVLAKGIFTSFTLPAGVQPIGYTRPDGKNLLADQNGVVRYNLSGVFQARLARGSLEGFAISSGSGLTEVVAGSRGVELVSNAGGLIRRLPVPGTAPKLGCSPVRWWTARTALVACLPRSVFAPRLWLVPVSGAAPAALTPIRKPPSHDLGDLDAWRLASGLYLQALGPCGTIFIGKAGPGGSVKTVRVPGGAANNNKIVAVLGHRMLVQAETGCGGSNSLLWFNPATRAVRKVLTAPSHSFGVLGEVPFNRKGTQPS